MGSNYLNPTKFACLECRSCFKRPAGDGGRRNSPRPIKIRKCPSCGGKAFLMGSDFRAPRKSDKKSWAVVEHLVLSGFPYFRLYEPLTDANDRPHAQRYSSGNQMLIAVQYPETLDQAAAFVSRLKDQALPFENEDGIEWSS